MMENRHSGSGFMNGLLLGIIIGAGLVFFLGTKKGKEMLRAITEEGLEDFSELSEYVTSKMDDEEEESYSEAPQEERSPMPHVSRPIKRFFRGVKR